jgi:hypothetical protein
MYLLRNSRHYLRSIKRTSVLLKVVAPNNGMHPTADTTALIYLESLGAAGDAER